jgi:hypothetical protein
MVSQRIDHIRITTKLILQILGETNHVPLGRVYIRGGKSGGGAVEEFSGGGRDGSDLISGTRD